VASTPPDIPPAMTLHDYLAPRTFRSPYLKRSESVSGAAALWALLLGPAYYWRKQAPVEALVLTVLDGALMLMPDAMLGIGSANDMLSLLVWLGFAAGAPVLLPICYRRKGWVEIGHSAEARWLSGSLERRLSPRGNAFADEHRADMIADRGALRNRLPLR